MNWNSNSLTNQLIININGQRAEVQQEDHEELRRDAERWRRLPEAVKNALLEYESSGYSIVPNW